jgi:DNA-binding MarR family transcriptional regulator
MLSLGEMNAIAFATKRAFHGFQKFTRKSFAAMGLTAARFDLLFLLPFPSHGRQHAGRWQSALWRSLGVTPGVVSRMLRSLEALGLVTRTREEGPGDRRQVRVALTRRGEDSVLAAVGCLARPVRTRIVESLCCGEHHDPERRLHHVSAFEAYLMTLRRDLGDTAFLDYGRGLPDNRDSRPWLTRVAR